MPNLKKKLTYTEMVDAIEADKSTIEDLYLAKNLTSGKVAKNQNIYVGGAAHKRNWSKALLRTIGKKGAGHGGKRPGSGNKKGIRFCGKCRRRLKEKEKCSCND